MLPDKATHVQRCTASSKHRQLSTMCKYYKDIALYCRMQPCYPWIFDPPALLRVPAYVFKRKKLTTFQTAFLSGEKCREAEGHSHVPILHCMKGTNSPGIASLSLHLDILCCQKKCSTPGESVSESGHEKLQNRCSMKESMGTRTASFEQKRCHFCIGFSRSTLRDSTLKQPTFCISMLPRLSTCLSKWKIDNFLDSFYFLVSRKPLKQSWQAARISCQFQLILNYCLFCSMLGLYNSWNFQREVPGTSQGLCPFKHRTSARMGE